MNEELAAQVRDVRFKLVRMREGYDMGDVDALLDQLMSRLVSGEPVGHLVRDARFKPVRMREGYDMGEVDNFLDDVVARAQTGATPVPTPPVAAAQAPVEASAAAYVGPIQQVPTLAERIKGWFR
jgi:DivIVA domain-containing protein